MANKSIATWIVWAVIIVVLFFILNLIFGFVGMLFRNPFITLLLVVVGYFIYTRVKEQKTITK